MGKEGKQTEVASRIDKLRTKQVKNQQAEPQTLEAALRDKLSANKDKEKQAAGRIN